MNKFVRLGSLGTGAYRAFVAFALYNLVENSLLIAGYLSILANAR